MTRNFVRGFTLMEFIILIAFLVILASFAYPIYISALERAKITRDMKSSTIVQFSGTAGTAVPGVTAYRDEPSSSDPWEALRCSTYTSFRYLYLNEQLA